MDDGANARSPIISVRTATFVILLIFFLAVGRDAMFRDPGTLWHTVVGDRILERRSVSEVDEFSFTRPGVRWIAQQWLGECAMSLVHRAAGLDGLLLLAAAVLAATYAGIAGRLHRAGLSTFGCALVIALVIAASSYHFNVRPHLAGIALMAVVFGLLCDVEAGRRPVRTLYWLPLILALWANIHGSALGGVATCVLVLVGWAGVLLLDRERSSVTLRQALQLLVIAVLCVGSILLNPYGLELPRVWLSLMNSSVIPRLISEHAPPNWNSFESMAFLALAVLYVSFFVFVRLTMLRVTWLLPLAWLLLAVSRVRHGPLFAAVAAIAIAEMLPYARARGLFPTFGRLLVQRGPHSPIVASGQYKVPGIFLGRSGDRKSSAVNAAICSGVCLLIFFLQTTSVRVPVVGASWARLDPSYWPVAATKVLAERIKDSPEPARVFNQMTYGGYLIYALPRARVYIDDRCELYGDDFLLKYDQLMRRPEGMDTVSDSEDIRYALVSSRSEMAIFFKASLHWRVLHEDTTAILAEHLRPSRRVIIEAPDLHVPGLPKTTN